MVDVIILKFKEKGIFKEKFVQKMTMVGEQCEA